jgi:hypothetical protein
MIAKIEIFGQQSMNPSIEARKSCSARETTQILLKLGPSGQIFFEIVLDMSYNLSYGI